MSEFEAQIQNANTFDIQPQPEIYLRCSDDSRGWLTTIPSISANPIDIPTLARSDIHTRYLMLSDMGTKSCTTRFTHSLDEAEILPTSMYASICATSQEADNRPLCFEHDCAGRSFYCSENYRRHLREKNAQRKAVCEYCLTLFTRKSNRDAHIRKGHCKMMQVPLGGDTDRRDGGQSSGLCLSDCLSL